MCACTCLRRSVIMRCADLERSCVNVNDVNPFTSVAPTTAKTMGMRNCTWRLVMTLSNRYLLDSGSTKPASRVDGRQDESQKQDAAARVNQRPDFGQRLPVDLLLGLFGGGFGGGWERGCGCGHRGDCQFSRIPVGCRARGRKYMGRVYSSQLTVHSLCRDRLLRRSALQSLFSSGGRSGACPDPVGSSDIKCLALPGLQPLRNRI